MLPAIIKKLKLIYIPFLILLISFLVVYSFLNWLLFMELDLFPLSETARNITGPLVFSGVCVMIWLRPRIKLFKKGKKDTNFIRQLLAFLAIAMPTVVAQDYLETATGKLTVLSSISQINTLKKTRYYSLENFAISRENMGVYSESTTGGKNNENYSMALYIAMPISAAINDTAQPAVAWLSVVYRDRISNSATDEEKDKRYRTFAEKSQQAFDTTNFEHFTYLQRIYDNDDEEAYEQAAKQSRKFNPAATVILKGVYAPFEERNGNTFIWIYISAGIGAVVMLLFFLTGALNPVALESFEKGESEYAIRNELKRTAGFFKFKKDMLVTTLLIYANVLMFLILVFTGASFMSFKTEGLLSWGANYRPYTLHGEWWRLLSNLFLHAGFIHVLTNMIGLLYIGLFLEPTLGRLRYFAVYMFTGVVASCASVWWYPATVSVGASGAIFGLYGFFLALLLMNVFPAYYKKTILAVILIFIGYNLLMGLAGGIDNAAHIGGLLSGFVTGLLMSAGIKREQAEKQTQPVVYKSDSFKDPDL